MGGIKGDTILINYIKSKLLCRQAAEPTTVKKQEKKKKDDIFSSLTFFSTGMWQQVTYLALLLGIFVEFTTSAAAEKTAELQDDYSSTCPPGYWCKKKREFDSSECPRGFICRSKRSTSSCPPGYWCRRSELVLDQPTDPKNCAAEWVRVV